MWPCYSLLQAEAAYHCYASLQAEARHCHLPLQAEAAHSLYASLQAEARRMQTENVELAAQAAERQKQSPGRPRSRQRQHSPRSSRAGSPGALPGRGDEGAPVALPPGSLDAQLQGLRRLLIGSLAHFTNLASL